MDLSIFSPYPPLHLPTTPSWPIEPCLGCEAELIFLDPSRSGVDIDQCCMRHWRIWVFAGGVYVSRIVFSAAKVRDTADPSSSLHLTKKSLFWDLNQHSWNLWQWYDLACLSCCIIKDSDSTLKTHTSAHLNHDCSFFISQLLQSSCSGHNLYPNQ